MRRLFVATLVVAALGTVPAWSADAPVRMPAKAPVAVAPVFNWTGFYVGGHGGWAWGEKRWSDPPSGQFIDFDTDGFFGGGQVGYNWQAGSLVVGIEADAAAAGIDGGAANTACAAFCGSRVRALGSVAGRIGFAPGNSLIYAKGGWAFANERHTAVTVATINANENRSGWTAGAGYEYAFAPNWSGKVEYDYYNFGTERVAFFPGAEVDVRQRLHAVKVGFNYRFGWAGRPY